MSETNSLTQLVFVLLFQAGLWLRLYPMPFNFKILSEAILDFCMLSITACEWQRFEVEWQIWVKKVWGELKNE
jgi:hypothetical protein